MNITGITMYQLNSGLKLNEPKITFIIKRAQVNFLKILLGFTPSKRSIREGCWWLHIQTWSVIGKL